jgi:AraC-like DNA-binding protein
MGAIYSVIEGDFGRVEVREISSNLVAHVHDQMQFVFWLGGAEAFSRVRDSVECISQDAAIGTNPFQSHDLFLQPNHAPAILLFLYIHVDWLDGLPHLRGQGVNLSQAKINLTTEIRAATWTLMQRITATKTVNLQVVTDEVVQLVRLTTDAAAMQMFPAVWSSRRKLIDYRLRQTLGYMQENLVQPSRINPIAKKVGISRSRLYELFHDELDTTPKLVWSSMHLKAAIHYMMTTRDDLATIATQLGFSSAGNFSRFFRSITGLSPLAYRRKNAIPYTTLKRVALPEIVPRDERQAAR